MSVSSSGSSPAQLPLKLMHVVVTLGVVSGLSLRKVLQTAQVVELWREDRRGGEQNTSAPLVQHHVDGMGSSTSCCFVATKS